VERRPSRRLVGSVSTVATILAAVAHVFAPVAAVLTPIEAVLQTIPARRAGYDLGGGCDGGHEKDPSHCEQDPDAMRFHDEPP
jgi:hypothetical protein